NHDVMRSDRLKQVMQQIDQNFDEKNAGFNRFSKFVVEAGQKGLLRVSKMDNGQYEVAPLAEAASPAVPATEAAAPHCGRPGRGGGGGRGGARGGGGGGVRGRGGRGGEPGPPAEPSSAPSPAPTPAARTNGLTLASAFDL